MRTTILSTILFFTGLTMQAQAPDGVVAVDLGLPSGTKWASMNVGATRSENKGERYAFGELEPKAEYIINNHLGYNGQAWTNQLLGYSEISGTIDDVAHVKWGGKWRMPTVEEFDELLKKCNRRSETLNGISGQRFTGPNGQSFFLPYPGSTDPAGYWTSTSEYLTGGPSYYYDFTFNWQSIYNRKCSWTSGLYIRPVINEEKNVSEVPLIVMDENIDFYPIDTSKVVVKLTKTLKQGWNTFVLPFAPGIQLPNVLYNRCELYQFQGYDNGVFKFTKLSERNKVYGNVPYLVYYKGETESITKYFAAHNHRSSYEPGNGYLNIQTGNPVVTHNNYSFTGTYETRTITKGNITGRDYILEGRSFRKVETNDTLRGFSAYMKTLLPDSLDDGSPIRIAIDGVLLEPRVLLDEIATTTPENETNVDVQVNINIPANQWNTICLPFDMNREQVKTAFGDDVQIADFVNWNSVEENDSAKIVNLLFSKGITAIECGHPYLIKTTKDITGFATNKVTINTSKYPMVETFDEENQRFGYFAGTYTTNYIWRSVYLKDGQPCLSPEEEECTINAFRGYFRLYGNSIIHKDTQINLAFIDTEKGDINGDGKLSIDDIAALIRLYYKDTGTVKSIDIDGDEKFTINDITQLILKFIKR